MSLEKGYVWLALVQVGLLVFWLTQQSWGAVSASVVGLVCLTGIYLAAKRKRQRMNEYFDRVQAELRRGGRDGASS